MTNNTRREFLADVGRGMLIASVGPALASDLALSPALADEPTGALSFGAMEPLVSLMQETPVDRLQPLLVSKLRSGTELSALVAAGALANARSFGGQDYVGYHAMMALTPAYEMSREMPKGHEALPVLKVLYRNTAKIQSSGGRSREVLRKVRPQQLPEGASGGERLREQTRRQEMHAAEQTFAALAQAAPLAAFNDLQPIVQDDINVHRVVLAWRAWDVLDLTGTEHAHTLLRQSVRFCVDAEQNRVQRGRPEPQIRSVLPKLLDEHRLLSRSLGSRKGDDPWIEELSATIFASSREQAADAVAAALAEGFAPQAVGQAISLAANQLVLHDPGRQTARPGKPVGSVHGASVGVHACDAANAWRAIASVTNYRNTVASLIVGAYHTAGQKGRVKDQPFPFTEQKQALQTRDAGALLRELKSAVEGNDQARASALVDRYGELGHSAEPVFDLLLRYAVSEDGALHAEKYYKTARQEFATTHEAFRWRHLVALARVTASEYGQPAPGYEEARRLLGV